MFLIFKLNEEKPRCSMSYIVEHYSSQLFPIYIVVFSQFWFLFIGVFVIYYVIKFELSLGYNYVIHMIDGRNNRLIFLKSLIINQVKYKMQIDTDVFMSVICKSQETLL